MKATTLSTVGVRLERDTWALLGAVAVHVTSLLALPHLAPLRLRALHIDVPAAAVEVDVVILPPGAPPDGLPLPVGAEPRPERRELGRRATAGEHAQPGELVEPGAPSGAGPGTAGPTGAGEDYGPVDPGGEGPRFGGLPPWSIPGGGGALPRSAPAPTTPGAPRKVDRDVASQVLRGTLGSGDRDKGLEVPLGGIVARAFADGARSMTLPHDSRATFEVVVDSAGKVIAVRHVSATAGDAALWQRLIAKVNTALAARALPTAGRARGGAIVSVTVVSRFVYPSGTAEPSMSDLGANKSDVIHATYSVRLPRERALPSGAVAPIDTSSPYTRALPKGVAPVEHKGLDPGR